MLCVYCAIIVFFCYWCTICVPSVLWYSWLGLLTCKNRLPYNLYCVGGDIKHCSLTHPHARPESFKHWQSKLQLPTARKKEWWPATADSLPQVVTCQHCDTHYFSRPRTHNLPILSPTRYPPKISKWKRCVAQQTEPMSMSLCFCLKSLHLLLLSAYWPEIVCFYTFCIKSPWSRWSCCYFGTWFDS